MDIGTFDRLTRRLVLGGIAGTPLFLLMTTTQTGARRASKRKRCRRQKRTFCAGRCCPAGRRCQNGACVASCEDPLVCEPGSGGGSRCGGEGCFGCVQTASGAAACIGAFNTDLCAGNEPCRSDGDCPAGTICVICNCGISGSSPDFRCVAPCASA